MVTFLKYSLVAIFLGLGFSFAGLLVWRGHWIFGTIFALVIACGVKVGDGERAA